MRGVRYQRTTASLSWYKVTMNPLRYSLLELYFGGSTRHIEADMAQRPKHYGAGYVELVERLRRGETLPVQRLNDLVLQYMRPTKAAEAQRSITTAKTAAARRPLRAKDLPAFEEQQALKGAIVLI